MELEEGDIVLCTVDRIVGTVVFVKIHDDDREGNIILSEVAPGRIRNLREYVVPKKLIVCKVLRIGKDRVDLSLRRVNSKETKEALEKFKQEKSYEKILSGILGDSFEETIKKIKEKWNLYDFIEEVKKNPKELENLVPEKGAEKILEILKNQKIKKFHVKKEIKLNTIKENGLELIKKVFDGIKNAEVKYIAAGRYSVKTESSDIKNAHNTLKEILKEIEEKAKKYEIECSVK